ncbi:MAG TPA: hypothetical protein VF407_14050 [Polyangiaceae bacterium]
MSAVRVVAIALGALAAVTPVLARADVTHDCVEAANDGQSLRDSGKWSAAHAAFVRCSADACPGVVTSSCRKWDAELAPRVPTVTFAASSTAGADIAVARFTIDGVAIANAAAGRALPLDPGAHDLVVSADGFEPSRSTIVVREGEKSRPIVVRLAPLENAVTTGPAPSEERSVPSRSNVPLVVSGAIALAGATGFAVFGLWGQSERSHLDATCAPSETCASSDVSAVRTKWIVADVSLAVGVVGAGFFTAFLIAPLLRTEDSKTAAFFSHVGVTPTSNGGAASFHATF